MGEIAEMILDGTLCDVCGGVFDDIVAGEEEPGYPRTCETVRGKKNDKTSNFKSGKLLRQ